MRQFAPLLRKLALNLSQSPFIVLYGQFDITFLCIHDKEDIKVIAVDHAHTEVWMSYVTMDMS